MVMMPGAGKVGVRRQNCDPAWHFDVYAGPVFDPMTGELAELVCLALEASPEPVETTSTVRVGRRGGSRQENGCMRYVVRGSF
jgi:hypothetical protein